MLSPPARNASEISASELLAPQLFWAFAPIALNTMTQPSGRVLELDVYYNFALRISPLICAVHGITTLIQLLRLRSSTKSLNTALLGVAAARLKLEDRSGAPSTHQHDGDAGEVHHLRRNSVFRLGLFMLGALPQAVVIFSSRGVPWSKACCAAFLFAFVLDEAVLYAWSRAGAHGLTAYDDLLPSHVLSPRRERLGLAGSMSELLVYFFSLVFAMLVVFKSRGMGLEMVVSVLTVLGLAGFVCIDRCFGDGALPPGPLATYFTISEVVMTAWGPGPESGDSFVGCGAGFLFVAVLVGFLENKYLRRRFTAGFPLATFVIMNHLGLFLTYLGTRYDSRDTLKPYWTNWLG